MKLHILPLFFHTLYALPQPLGTRQTKPPFFLLAGDSTTATQSAGGGGWGDGFLNTTLFHGASGQNYGHNGATTVSFREGGDWATVLDKVADVKAAYRAYVTIQFGHNDQKAKHNISLSEYRTNLENLADEVRSAGAIPILVTPLSRRNYDNSSAIVRNLENERVATIQAAGKRNVSVIDLNRASTRYLNQIGPENAHTYDLKDGDSTHLNVPGSQVFGGMVAELIIERFPELKVAGFVGVDRGLREALQKGQYYWPN